MIDTVTTDTSAPPVVSEVPGIGKMKLGDLPDLDASILDEAIRRVLPDTPPVPVAAFNSAV